MSVGSSCSGSTGYYGANHASNLALSYNRQQDIQAQNAKTGGNYDYNKEVAATNAQTILDIFA